MILALLLPSMAAAGPVEPVRQASAHVVITRAYAPGGPDIQYETVCEKDIAVPVFDFRERPDLRPEAARAELSCPSRYRDQAVPVVVRGIVELVRPERQFGLAVPPSTELKRLYFTLDVDAGANFPYLPELQLLTGWQFFAPDVALHGALFALSPETEVEVDCVGSVCKTVGPQSVFRAQVSLVDPAP